MKRYLKKCFLFFLILFLITEIGSRVFLDPIYFYTINPYLSPSALTNFQPSDLLKPEPNHVDNLFIGTSRVAAGINPTLFDTNETSSSLNVGRGYVTGATHLFNLQKMIQQHPDFIKGANVFIELPGSAIYPKDSTQFKFETYPKSTHFLLPYLRFEDLKLIYKSDISLGEKKEITLQFFFSCYRTYPFFQEYKSRILNKIKTKLSPSSNSTLENSGGIKTNLEEIDYVKKSAIRSADKQIKQQANQKCLNLSELDQSIIAAFHNLIQKNGGELIFFEMPLHSVQQKIHQTPFAFKNASVFKEWAHENNIQIISMKGFPVQDSDFPDYWHMSKELKEEFTQALLKKL